MRRQEKEITDKKLLEEILMKSKICRLGLVDGDEAYIVPVNYAYHEGEIWIHSAPEGRKMELLRRGISPLRGRHQAAAQPSFAR